MSGGVDSSVTALLLKEQGYHVIGLFMKNWEETDAFGQCTSSYDAEDARLVCNQIGIPFHVVNFVEDYKNQVFANFIQDFQNGYTPNPDILCNREIKFKVFLEKALALGADYLATGHYAQIRESNGKYHLIKGLDRSKDQSYFLYTLKSEILERVLFPLGSLEKKTVRAIAKSNGLVTSEKKDSTGICFIGERHFRSFMSQYLGARPGFFRNLDGKIVGNHLGAAYYTIGQRKGLGIGGPGDAWFVADKDIQTGDVYVVQGGEHPALYSDSLVANEVSWIVDAPPHFPLECQAKVRYRQIDHPCVIERMTDQGQIHVSFPEPERAVTPGQSIVFYQDDVCLGGAVIHSRSLYAV